MPELDKMCERRRGGEMKSVKVLVWHGGHRRLKIKKEDRGDVWMLFDPTG